MEIRSVADKLTKRCLVLGLRAESFQEERAIGFLYNVFHMPGTKITVETIDGSSTEISVSSK